jgi:hypothetical protein
MKKAGQSSGLLEAAVFLLMLYSLSPVNRQGGQDEKKKRQSKPVSEF